MVHAAAIYAYISVGSQFTKEERRLNFAELRAADGFVNAKKMRRSLSLRKAAGITHLHSRPPPPRTLCAPSPTQLLPHLYPSPFTPASTYPSAPSTLTRPLLLTSLLTDWPALQSWTRENAFGELREASEGVKVEVELGRVRRGYLDKEWKRVEMGLCTCILSRSLRSYKSDD